MIFPIGAVIASVIEQQNLVRRSNEEYEKKKKDKEIHDYSKQIEKGKEQ